MKVYWANALFSEADRDFNIKSARRLRASGYEVFLAQEDPVNHDVEPNANAVFRVDTAKILMSDVVVACLDQESIDSGVACEAGLAYAYGIRVIGLYTDIRRVRTGRGRMYKNLYVIGAIEALGAVVTSLDELLEVLHQYVETQCTVPSREPKLFGAEYDEFVGQLETWYSPTWKSVDVVERWVERLRPRSVVELGSGSGRLGGYLCERYHDLGYIGVDTSVRMTAEAHARYASSRCRFLTSVSAVPTQSADLVLAVFTLHDHADKMESLAAMVRILKPGGAIGIIDLSDGDLPRLTNLVRRGLGRPAAVQDERLSATWLWSSARAVGLHVIDCAIAVTEVRFPTGRDIDHYFDTFDIYSGADLPLGFRSEDRDLNRAAVQSLLGELMSTFVDERAFILCLMT